MSDNNQKARISRRKFLKTVGTVAGGFTLSGFLGATIFKGATEPVSEKAEKYLNIKLRDTDPENPSKGDVWLRKDMMEG